MAKVLTAIVHFSPSQVKQILAKEEEREKQSSVSCFGNSFFCKIRAILVRHILQKKNEEEILKEKKLISIGSFNFICQNDSMWLFLDMYYVKCMRLLSEYCLLVFLLYHVSNLISISDLKCRSTRSFYETNTWPNMSGCKWYYSIICWRSKYVPRQTCVSRTLEQRVKYVQS